MQERPFWWREMCKRLLGWEEQAEERLCTWESKIKETKYRSCLVIFQQFIKSQARKSYASFCELADMKKSPLQPRSREARRGRQSRRSSTPGKEVALIWHHCMNMKATRRKIIIKMHNFFPKTISFKCKIAPNDNIPVDIWDVLQKRVAVAWWTLNSESQALYS